MGALAPKIQTTAPIAGKIRRHLPLSRNPSQNLCSEAHGGVMSQKPEKPCPACGEPKNSCVRCRAEKLRDPQGFLGIPFVSWLILILGGGIALMVWLGS